MNGSIIYARSLIGGSHGEGARCSFHRWRAGRLRQLVLPQAVRNDGRGGDKGAQGEKSRGSGSATGNHHPDELLSVLCLLSVAVSLRRDTVLFQLRRPVLPLPQVGSSGQPVRPFKERAHTHFQGY